MTESPSSLPCSRTVDLGAYLLGGLADIEAQDLRRHIDGCVYCAPELSELRPVADLLATADFAVLAHDLAPDPQLRERLFERVAAESVASPTAVSIARPKHRRRMMAVAVASFALGAAVPATVRQAADRPKQEPKFGWETVRFGQRDYYGTKLEAVAWLATTKEGTSVWLSSKGLSPNRTYGWWFERPDGTRIGLGKFVAQSDTWVLCTGTTDIGRGDLRLVGITDITDVANKHDIVEADVPKFTA